MPSIATNFHVPVVSERTTHLSPLALRDALKSWLRQLARSDFAYHLDDEAADCLADSGLGGEEIAGIAANVKTCRDILGEETMWDVYYDASKEKEAVEAANSKAWVATA
jgi:hypothetical protein